MTHPLPSPSTFKSSTGEVAYLSAYDAAMKVWPVPYEGIEISNRFGLTHVVASGPKNASPLVLLHGYWATLTMWTPNISDFSKGPGSTPLMSWVNPARASPTCRYETRPTTLHG